jgi:hypothetical protein
MSKIHPFRVQLHCDQHMHALITRFASQRGLSQSAAARYLVDRALTATSDDLTGRLDVLEHQLGAILHASCATRIMASELGSKAGVDLQPEEYRQRIAKLVERYKS